MGVHKRGDTGCISYFHNGQIYLTGDRTKNGKPQDIPVTLPLVEELARLQRLRDDGCGKIIECGAEGGI
ncbi:MAG: hypothetical protein OEM47_03100 [Deltaproteobacteria bacterium]|nr:hypothetical protein [Deltaproteobacteria bacterium]